MSRSFRRKAAVGRVKHAPIFSRFSKDETRAEREREAERTDAALPGREVLLCCTEMKCVSEGCIGACMLAALRLSEAVLEYLILCVHWC